jgi:hypothetical protein
MEYCDDDREYIRVRKTEAFVPEQKDVPRDPMAYLQEYLKTHASSDVQGRHTVYWIPFDVFRKLPMERWRFNRPPDEERVAEIREWMRTSERVDGIIYLAAIGPKLVCYESNHRREATEGLMTLHNVLVDILWDATDEEVKQEFFRLNKAVSVPELYVTEAPSVQLDELRKAVDAFCENYKSLKVPTGRPQRPNFNRDMITDEFYRMTQELKIGVHELMDRLMTLNTKLRTRDKSKLTDKVRAKCEATGLWLFAWSAKLNSADLS